MRPLPEMAETIPVLSKPAVIPQRARRRSRLNGDPSPEMPPTRLVRLVQVGCLLVSLLALLLFSLPGITAQTSGQERPILQLEKRITTLDWISQDTILATVGGFTSREVVLVNLMTGEVKHLAVGSCGSASPDRLRVAWVPGPGSVGDVWILELQTLGRRQLTNGISAVSGVGGPCVRWSPDGRRIAVTIVRPTDPVGWTQDIMIVSADNGQGEHRVRDEVAGGAADPAWTPDSRRLAFSVSYLADGRIDLYDLQSRRTIALLKLQREAGPPTDLAYSPDGTTLLFVVRGTIQALRGASVTTITSGHAPAWRPDGKAILFARGSALYMVDY